MIPPKKLLWSPDETAHPRGLLWREHSVAHFLQRQGQWVQLHCVLQKHSTALWTGCCIPWAMGERGQGGNPDSVLCHCHIGACTCATVPGAAIGTLTLLCELISSSSTIFTVGCPLIGHNSQGTISQQSLLHCLTTSASNSTRNLQVS